MLFGAYPVPSLDKIHGKDCGCGFHPVGPNRMLLGLSFCRFGMVRKTLEPVCSFRVVLGIVVCKVGALRIPILQPQILFRSYVGQLVTSFDFLRCLNFP
jgi:hypothetical protein